MSESNLNTVIFVREYEEHAPQLLNYLTRTANGNEADGHDLLQETMLKAWKARSNFKGKCSVKSWLFTIGINHFREKIRRKKLVHFSAELPEVIAPERSTPESYYQHDLRTRIDEEISQLPADQQEVFNLIRNIGMSYKEAAAELGITVDTVRMRLHRANTRLAYRLQDLKDYI